MGKSGNWAKCISNLNEYMALYSVSRMDISQRYELDRHGRIALFEQSKQALLECVQSFMEEHALQNLTPAERRAMFPAFIRYARKECPHVPPDVLLIDSLFDVYLDLCVAFDYSPTLFMFSEMLSLDGLINHWECDITMDLFVYEDENGKTATSSRRNIVKKWRARCAGLLASQLQNTDGASVNRIFISKAIYGLRDDAPQQDDTKQSDVVRVDALPDLSN